MLNCSIEGHILGGGCVKRHTKEVIGQPKMHRAWGTGRPLHCCSCLRFTALNPCICYTRFSVICFLLHLGFLGTRSPEHLVTVLRV